MVDERWKPIDGYQGIYEVSNLGRVRSIGRTIVCKNGMKKTIRPKILARKKHRNGYVSSMLCVNGVQKRILIHRAVASAFVPNPNGYPEVNHKDEDKENNESSNLEWCTKSYNNTYGTLPARKALRFGKPVNQIKDGVIVATYPSAMEAHRVTGITPGGISGCCRGEIRSSGGYQWELA